MYRSTTHSGFTLVEVLIVISTLIILAVIVFFMLPEAVARSRDATRLTDANQIISALDQYLVREGTFPANQDNDYNDWDCNVDGTDNEGFIRGLTEAGLIATIMDPRTDYASCADGGTRYQLFTAGTHGCDANKGDFYVLEIVDLEHTVGTHPDSPGFSCSGYDWQTEADWVAGKFQYPTR